MRRRIPTRRVDQPSSERPGEAELGHRRQPPGYRPRTSGAIETAPDVQRPALSAPSVEARPTRVRWPTPGTHPRQSQPVGGRDGNTGDVDDPARPRRRVELPARDAHLQHPHGAPKIGGPADLANFGLGISFAILFLISWIAQAIAEWQVFTDEQAAHGESASLSEFWFSFGQSTLENWQSEFLQLFSFVVLAAADPSWERRIQGRDRPHREGGQRDPRDGQGSAADRRVPRLSSSSGASGIASGPIVLLGSGEFQAWSAALELEVLQAASGDGSVAVVPAASAPEGETYASWANDGLEHFAELGVPARVVELKSRSDADDSSLARELERVSAVFFSGGHPAFLAGLLGGSKLWDAVRGAVERGAAFFGCSAGACVAGEFAPDSVTEYVWEDRWAAGLRLVPNVWVLPHFDALNQERQGTRDYFLSRVPQDGWALGIDEDTAVARLGSMWSVHGRGGAFVSRRSVAARFGPGATFEFERWPEAEHATGAAGAIPADPSLVAITDAQPVGSGPIALFSSEQFSEGTRSIEEAMLRRCGPTVGVVLLADPSNVQTVCEQALAYYAGLGAAAIVVGAHDALDEIDYLFLAGGDPSNLVPALDGSLAWKSALERWRDGMGLAGSSAGAMALCERCLFPTEGDDVPTTWGRGLGPLRNFALAVHSSSRPEDWLERVASTTPVPLMQLDDGCGLLLAPGEPPLVFGGGAVALVAEGTRLPVGTRGRRPEDAPPVSAHGDRCEDPGGGVRR